MSELDEYKQNIPENWYIQLANLLKEQFNNEKLNTINDIENIENNSNENYNNTENSNENTYDDTDWEEDSESEETNNNINREISTCLQIIYIPKYEAILKKYIDYIPFQNYYILIENNNSRSYKLHIMQVQQIIEEFVFDSLPLEGLQEFIDIEGGIENAIQNLKKFIDDDQQFHNIMLKMEEKPLIQKMKSLAYHSIGFHFFCYSYVDNDDIPLLYCDDVIELRSMKKTVEEIFSTYLKNKLHVVI